MCAASPVPRPDRRDRGGVSFTRILVLGVAISVAVALAGWLLAPLQQAGPPPGHPEWSAQPSASGARGAWSDSLRWRFHRDDRFLDARALPDGPVVEVLWYGEAAPIEAELARVPSGVEARLVRVRYLPGDLRRAAAALGEAGALDRTRIAQTAVAADGSGLTAVVGCGEAVPDSAQVRTFGGFPVALLAPAGDCPAEPAPEPETLPGDSAGERLP